MQRSPHTIHCLILLAVVGFVFSRVVGNSFVGDDLVLTIGNPAYRDFQLDRIIFSLANGLEYLPVRDLSLALDYLIWGENPAGFHTTGLIIYLAACTAAYWVTLLLAQHYNHEAPARLAFAAALLFGLQPTHAEAVGMLACRNVLLSGLFVLLATGCYLRFRAAATPRPSPWLAAALCCFVLALFSKATSISLPLALLGIDLITPPPRGERKLWPLLPFVIMAGATFALFRTIATTSNIIGKGTDHGGFLGNAAVALQVPFFYLGKLLLPHDLGTEYPDLFATSLLSPLPLAALAGSALILAALAWLGRRQAIVALAATWFAVFLLPVLNFFRTYPTVADRYIFLSSYGFALLLAWGLCRLATVRPKLAAAIGLLLIVGWGTITALRLPTWRTELSYWQDALATNPMSIKAIQAIGSHYYTAGQLEPAFTYLARVRALDPSNPMYDYCRGDVELLRGNPHTAIPHLQSALARKDDCIMALYDLGEAYAAIGQREQAIDAYRRIFTSKELDPQGFYKRAAQEGLRKLGSQP